MATRKLTPEQEASKELENKSILDYIKEGKTPEEAKAIVLANRQKTNQDGN
jgi:hypothetical protein